MSAEHFSHLTSGESCVRLSGDEIAEHVGDAASTIDTAIRVTKRTTSEAGLSSRICDSILATLCSCVVAATCGLIPELTQNDSSFDLRLILSSCHTRWTDDGREIPDSHRYRLCGNGVVAPVAEWIGHRLMAVDALAREAIGVA